MADIGCEAGQGYFFARPSSPTRIRAFIADHLE
jgi:EAL domain-containing protein (putative c-di-GMP-specific phosphodiesterase class I)